MFVHPFNIPVVGLVGGPGAGKTSIWSALKSDSRLVLTPEAPTLLQSQGLWYPRPDPDFETDLDSLRWLLEKKSAGAAAARGAVMVVTDRIRGEGPVVYSGNPALAAATPVVEILASYYALVVVEMPPEDVWVTSQANKTNAARTERAYAEAVQIHEALLAYVAPHPRLHVVKNSHDPVAKIGRGVEIIDQLLREVSGEVP